MTDKAEEKCEITSHEFCQNVYILVPYVDNLESCIEVKQEFCDQPRRTNPTKVLKQKLRKICNRINSKSDRFTQYQTSRNVKSRLFEMLK